MMNRTFIYNKCHVLERYQNQILLHSQKSVLWHQQSENPCSLLMQPHSDAATLPFAVSILQSIPMPKASWISVLSHKSSCVLCTWVNTLWPFSMFQNLPFNLKACVYQNLYRHNGFLQLESTRHTRQGLYFCLTAKYIKIVSLFILGWEGTTFLCLLIPDLTVIYRD